MGEGEGVTVCGLWFVVYGLASPDNLRTSSLVKGAMNRQWDSIGALCVSPPKSLAKLKAGVRNNIASRHARR